MLFRSGGSKFHPLIMNIRIKGGYVLANIEEKVENLIFPKIRELGYELYDVEYSKEGKDYFLRIFIDSENRNRFK